MSLLDRLIGRPQAATRKAVYGGPALAAYQNDVPLSMLAANDPHRRMAAYLRAYKVGWFYKGGKKISQDIAGLARTLAYEDTEGDNAEEIVARALNVPFESLDPLEQFLRLLERPNPSYTGRTLFTKTQIRLDFAGLAFWYLENGDGGDLPTAIYGISPTRMTPSRDKAGNLLGWVLDADDRGGGTPFTPEEILAFVVPAEVDDPWTGQGVVEAVYAHVPLTEAMTRHVGDVLATGGRLAGMLWPKERTLDEAEFLDAQRAWRNTTSDPNAARRLLIFPEPMEYATGAASPSEIGIPELAALSRDDILTAFPISPHILQVPLASGLNSGESLNAVRAEYWEGAIHPRVELLEESIQTGLVSRYENAIGRPLDFDIEEPNLDDAASVVEKVGALRGLIAVGFDPKEGISAVGLDHIKWNGLPDLLDPAKQAMMAQQAATAAQAPDPAQGMRVVASDPSKRDAAATQQTVVGKAAMRSDIIDGALPGLQATLRAFLDEQKARVIARLPEVLPKTKAERMKALPPDWWDPDAEDEALREALKTAYLTITRGALGVVADTTDRIIAGKSVDRVLEAVLARSGLRITDINETTRKSIAETLDIGVKRGYSIPQLVNGVAHEQFGGVQGALTANGVNVWDSYRAEVIARTETMLAYNEAALIGYKDVNVNQVVAIDGDKDAECASRDGQAYSTDDALNVTDHPNGTLDWVPITDKAWHEDAQAEAWKAIALMASREQPAPVVTVTTPLSVPVTVNVPEQTAPVVNVSTPDTVVNLPEQPAPIVNVTTPDVTVHVPDQRPPLVHVTSPEVVVNVPEAPAAVVNVETAAPVIQNTVNVPKAQVTVKSTGEMRITEMPTRLTTRKVTQRAPEGIAEVTEVETDA